MELCKNVTVRFGDKTVLQDVTLRVPEKKVTWLSGPSGVGKTTLLRVLAGLVKPQTGEVTLPGRGVMLFQEDRLFPRLPALDQVRAVLPRQRRGEAVKWLELVGLDQAAALPPGKLSGGMARRVALARALAVEGEVYLLDEPFAGVDLERAGHILTRLKDLGRTVVVTGHEGQLAHRCDHSVELN